MGAGMRYQPQGLTKLARTGLLRGAQALISSTVPMNLITGKTLQQAGPVTRGGTGAGVSLAFRKNSYVETESLPAIGTQSFVEFWFGYPSADPYARGDTSAPGFVTGQNSNNIAIAATVGTNTSNTGSPDPMYWGAVYNWPSMNHAGEKLTAGKLALLVVVRRQSGMEFWHDGQMVRSVLQSPTSYPAGTMICGSFVENTDFWTSSNDTLLAGRFVAEWSAAEVRQFSTNVWQLFAEQEDDDYRASTTQDSQTATAATGTFASTLGQAMMSAAGQVIASGSFASTLGAATMSASGGVGSTPYGAFASTLAGCTMASAGTVTANGTFASTLGNATMSASGSAAVNPVGSFSSTLQGASMYSSGYLGNTPPAPSARPYRWRIGRRGFSN